MDGLKMKLFWFSITYRTQRRLFASLGRTYNFKAWIGSNFKYDMNKHGKN